MKYIFCLKVKVFQKLESEKKLSWTLAQTTLRSTLWDLKTWNKIHMFDFLSSII